MRKFTVKRPNLGGRGRRMLSALLLLYVIAMGQTDLLVCLPGKQNTQLLQNCFDTLLGSSHSVVFGRMKDLEATMPRMTDAPVIAFAPLFNYVHGYKSVLLGRNKKTSGDKFFIVAASKEVTKENIAEKKVGIVDLLFKNHLSPFIKSQFDVDIKLLKKVNKEDDLLTMLGLEAVDAIIVSSAQYHEILSNTKLPITIVATSKSDVGFAVCAAKDGRMAADLKKTLLRSSPTLLREMGIDSWETTEQ